MKLCKGLKNVYLDGITVLDEDVLMSSEFQEIIKNCNGNYSFDSKYSLIFLNGDKVILSDITDEELKFLTGKTGIKALSLTDCSNLSDNNTREVLSTLTGLKDLVLKNVKKLSSIDFVTALPNLLMLDLRGTAVTDLNVLETLAKQNKLSLGTLIIDNENINLTQIQTAINKISTNYKQGGFELLGKSDMTRGFVMVNQKLVESIVGCANINNFKCYYGNSQLPGTVKSWNFDFSSIKKMESIVFRGFDRKDYLATYIDNRIFNRFL